jgi:hypothetical protein
MAVNVLDVAVSIATDKTQVDAAFDQIPGQAQQAFGAAEGFAQQFNAVLNATAEKLQDAGAQLPSMGQAFRTLRITGPDHLKQGLDNATLAFKALQEGGVTAQGTLLQATIKVTEREIAYHKALGDTTTELQKRLGTLKAQYDGLGGSVEDAGQKTEHSFHEARGAVDLLSNSVGITLPREIKSFIASLPGVSTALSFAFVPAAILGIIEVVSKAIEKQAEYRAALLATAIETRNVVIEETGRTEGIELSNLKRQDQIALIEGRPNRNRLQEALLAAKQQADELATS